MLRRMRHAVALWRQLPDAPVILSGGLVGHPPAEALVMRTLALQAGVPDRTIVVEDRSRNTFENALHTGKIMRERRWRTALVVTDAFHMPRALMVFRTLGLNAVGRPVPKSPETSTLFWLGAWGREAIAFTRSAMLFAIGRHKPIVAQEWGQQGAGP